MTLKRPSPPIAHPSFAPTSLPVWLQVVTVLFLIAFGVYLWAVHRAWKAKTPKGDLRVGEKTLAVTAVGGFITVSVAGASILLAGTGVLLALEPGNTPLPTRVFTDLGVATAWLVVSLVCGAIAAAYVINHIHHKQSVAEHPLVMAFAAAQLLAFAVGAIYFFVAILLF